MNYRQRGYDLYEAMDHYEVESEEDEGPMTAFDAECFEAGWHDGAA